MLLLNLVVLVVGTMPLPAPSTRTYCGVRSGTAGNAFLDNRKTKTSLTLAEQGGSQDLLDQIDNLIGPYRSETGTQNGQSYCAVFQLDKNGKPTKVVKAWRQSK